MSWRNIGNATAAGVGGVGGLGGNYSNGDVGGGGAPPSKVGGGRPSDARRAALTQADNQSFVLPGSGGNSNNKGNHNKGGGPYNTLSNLCPIERYYDIADRLRSAFISAYDNKDIDDAYVLGKRFARFSFESLPKHGYYYSNRIDLTARRERNRKDAGNVIRLLEEVVRWMDDEELEKQRLYEIQMKELLKKKEEERRLILQKRAEEKLRLLELEEIRKKKEAKEAKKKKKREQKLKEKQLQQEEQKKLLQLKKKQEEEEQEQQEGRQDKEEDEELNTRMEVSSQGDVEILPLPTTTTTMTTTPLSSSMGQQQQSTTGLPPRPSPSSSSSFPAVPPSLSDVTPPAAAPPSYNEAMDTGLLPVNLDGPPSPSPPPPSFGDFGGFGTTSESPGVEAMDNMRNDLVHTLDIGAQSFDTQDYKNMMMHSSSLPTGYTLPPPPDYSSIMSGIVGGSSSISSGITSSTASAAAAAAAGGAALDFGRPTGIPSVSTSTPPKKKLPNEKPSPEDAPVPIEELRDLYTREYFALRKKKRVEVYELGTYQGRLKSPSKDSTNGCTVISPLVVIRHLNTPQNSSISDSAIESVIDDEAPPILHHVRNKLGLSGDALIIPSDVHDCLVDKKLLYQEQFVGACGGNLLDPVHRKEVLNLLSNGFEDEDIGFATATTKNGNGQSSSSSPPKMNGTNKNNNNNKKKKRVGAALFYHEHVISIVKIIHRSKNPKTGLVESSNWFDLIDSMPRLLSNGKNGYATRTRCRDLYSLEVVLRWYAVTKLTDSDCNYVNDNLWNDALCDFDPRVFQAFVWGEK